MKKNSQVDVELSFKTERDDQQCKYFITVTALTRFNGLLHSLVVKLDVDDKTITDGFAGNKDEALKVVQHNAVSKIVNQILDEARKREIFILS